MAERGLVVSVDEDRRAGEQAQRGPLGKLLDRWRGKDSGIGAPTEALSAGWQGYGPGGYAMYRTGPRRLSQLATAYGGTNDSVTWVFACVSRIASEGASFPYVYADLLDNVIENPPEDLQRLLIKPNERMSYFDFAEATLTDLELLGNSYWLKDQRNGKGQPKEILRLTPEKIKIAVGPDGRERGYVYDGPGGTMIPYDLDEVIHFKYPNPLDEHYGMGTVEAIARALDQEIAQSLHVTGFFQNGARISGILTVPDVLTDTTFQRIKQQFIEEFAGAANAFKVLVAEGGRAGAGPDFKPITQSPNTLGVVDLRKLSKDEILSGFGIPEFLIGGAAQAGIYKMEEAQHIFLRGMIPRCIRFSERVTIDLAALWGDLKVRLMPHANEPLSVKIEHAKAMLGAGACLDESREAMGLPALKTEASRAPLVPASMITMDQLFQRPAEKIPVQTPAGGVAVEEPPEQEKPEDETEITNPEDVPEETQEEEPEKAADARPKGVSVKAWRRPVLPPGFESPSAKSAQVTPQPLFEAMAEHHAEVLIFGTPIVRRAMVQFFTGQRKRVTDRLSEYGPSSRRARGGRLKSGPLFSKDSLTPEGLWDQEQEDRALREAYLQAIDMVGAKTLEKPPALSGIKVAWDLQNPNIAQARDRLAEKVKRVNDTTRRELADAVDTGIQRGYSVVQIANGLASEGYPGILGVFDQAVHDRAETIARTETAMAYNAATVAGYQQAGVEKVEVTDGEGDQPCLEANGQTWTLDEANSDPIAHPNCVRAFIPIVGEPEEEPVAQPETPLTSDEQAAAEQFGGAAPAFNEALREGPQQDIFQRAAEARFAENGTTLAEAVGSLDRAIQKSPGLKGGKMYAQVPRSVVGIEPMKLVKGYQWKENGFLPVTSDIARAQAGARGPIMRIRVPPKVRALDRRQLEGASAEPERLLGRGHRIEVTGKPFVEDGVQVIPARLIPTSAPPRIPTAPPPMADFRKVTGSEFEQAVEPMFKTELGKFLTRYSAREYDKMRPFLAAKGLVGGALKPAEGEFLASGDPAVDIVSVFRAPLGPAGSGMEIAKRLVEEGGNRLDCIGEDLRARYEKELGFEVVKTIKWDDQYAPEGWDYARFGRPNIYVMELPKQGVEGQYGKAGAAFEREVEKKLADGDVGVLRHNDASGVNASYKGQVGGIKAAVKPLDATYEGFLRIGIPKGTDAQRERASYLIAQRMGIPAPSTVVRDIPPEAFGEAGRPRRAIVTRWMDGEPAWNADESGIDAQDFRNMGLFDAVIDNTDRHFQNALVRDYTGPERPGLGRRTGFEGLGPRREPSTAAYRIYPIDHGLTFPKPHSPIQGSTHAWKYAARDNTDLGGPSSKLTEEERQTLEGLLDPAVTEELRNDAGLETDAIRGMQERVKLMLKESRVVSPDENP